MFWPEILTCHTWAKFYNTLLIIIFLYNLYVFVQGIHKRIVRFQKLTRNLFVTLHWHNVHRQQRQLSKFLMR
jgi:hypothetical protein